MAAPLVDHSDNHMTGGKAPNLCHAPMKLTTFQRLRVVAQRQADARRALYRDVATTGGRDPKDCCAPLKPRNLVVRRHNEGRRSILERRGVPPLRLGPLLPRGGARHGAHGGPCEAQPAPPAPPACLSAVSAPVAPDPRYMTPPRR